MESLTSPQTVTADTDTKFNYLKKRYLSIRQQTEKLCIPLEPEDYVIQTMVNISPTKWHLAHTSWFFETFVLKEFLPGFKPLNPKYAYLFNSYYIQAGARHCRPKRGLISRPTVREVYEFRAFVDEHMIHLLENPVGNLLRLAEVIEIGLNHEQQHQELMLTDIKHVFSMNPLYPAYIERNVELIFDVPKLGWIEFEGGLFEIGHSGSEFCYDNETPRHKVYLEPYRLSNRLITNAEYLSFMEDGGYERPELWLSDGWDTVQKEGWNAPYYWEKRPDDGWWMITLQGPRKVNPGEPVCHVSHYEADAYARWSGHRLPTEAEWEIASLTIPYEGNFVDNEIFHPVPVDGNLKPDVLNQMHGDVWEWTQSAYLPYPGYKPLPGALGEYNGKFMANQMVLRGGSCATPLSHIRKTYRNFFHPDSRWQFTGIRLASEI